MTEWRRTSQPVVTAALPMDKVEKTVKDLEWPFGGGGVMWTEEEGEKKQGKGSASVEEVIAEPRWIFEEIFDFDK